MNNTLSMPLKVRAYAHQQAAFDFVCEQFGLLTGRAMSRGVCLLMEMGCGKSLVAIAVAGILYQLGLATRVLIVGPLSTLSVWEEQLAAFAGFPYTLTILKGSSAKKREQIQNIPDSGLQIIVVNYESARILRDELAAWQPQLTVADEGHKLKENRSQQSKALHHIGDVSQYRLLLTGTVISGKELDVFSQYRFANRHIFGTSFYAFRNRYFDMLGYGNHVPVFRKALTGDFLQKMHSIAFRTTKEECLDLPETTEEVYPIILEDKAQKQYQELMKESYTELKGEDVSAPNVLTKLLRLSQLTGGFLTDDAGDCSAVSTAKLDALSDIMDSALAGGKKLVVIARFTAEMDAIEEMMRKKKVKYSVIRGGVKDRDVQIQKFQNDPETMIFLGQIQAAGLGITLTAASTMVFYSMDYSMSNFDQCKSRIHRISQKENCHYIYLCCRGTVDMKVLRALRNKINLAKTLVDDYRNGRNPYA